MPGYHVPRRVLPFRFTRLIRRLCTFIVAGNILSSHKLSSLHTMVKAQGFNVQSRAGWRTSVSNNYIDATPRGLGLGSVPMSILSIENVHFVSFVCGENHNLLTYISVNF